MPGRERRHQVDEPTDRPVAGLSDQRLRPATGDERRRPGQGHRRQAFAEPVVRGVEQPVAGDATVGRHDALGLQRGVQHLAAGLAQERPVEVHEDGSHRSEATGTDLTTPMEAKSTAGRERRADGGKRRESTAATRGRTDDGNRRKKYP